MVDNPTGVHAGTAGANGNAKSMEALEMDNQRAVESLRGSAGAMKDLAISIDTDVNEQNRMLDRMDKRFDNTQGLLAQTTRLLREMTMDKTGTRMCSLIMALTIGLTVIYYWLRK